MPTARSSPAEPLIGIVPADALGRLTDEFERGAEFVPDAARLVHPLRFGKPLWRVLPGYLLGSWKRDNWGILVSGDGSYTGVLLVDDDDEPEVLVVLRSLHVVLAAGAQPPFLGMADVMTRGSILAYTAPPELLDTRFPAPESIPGSRDRWRAP